MSNVEVHGFRRDPMRSWKDADDDSGMVCYLGVTGRVTVAELLEYFAEKHPDVDPMALRLNFATAVWEEPATPEDMAARRKWRADHAAKTEKWERETLARLMTKYGEG